MPFATLFVKAAHPLLFPPYGLYPLRFHPLDGVLFLSPTRMTRRCPLPAAVHASLGVWHIAMVYCSHLQLAAPTGRSPFAPFPWTLSINWGWCPLALHHLVSFLFLLALSFPLYFPFLSLGPWPWCPSASHPSFPFLSLGRLCQRSPWTWPVSLLRVESTQRKATAFAVGQERPSGHPKPVVRGLSPTAAFAPWDVQLCGPAGREESGFAGGGGVARKPICPTPPPPPWSPCREGGLGWGCPTCRAGGGDPNIHGSK